MMGGGLGTWVSERRKLNEEMRATNTLSGMSAAYGGMLSSPLLSTILVLELARPKARRFADTLVAGAAVLLDRVRRVLPDRGVDVRWALHAAVLQIRGLATTGGAFPSASSRGLLALVTVVAIGGVRNSPLGSAIGRFFAQRSGESPSDWWA